MLGMLIRLYYNIFVLIKFHIYKIVNKNILYSNDIVLKQRYTDLISVTIFVGHNANPAPLLYALSHISNIQHHHDM